MRDSDKLFFRQRPIDGATSLTGILGYGVEHTITPLLYSELFEKIGLNSVYVTFNVPLDQLENALRGIRGLGIKAVFVTMPHKRNVIPFLDEVDALAAAMGAVNLIVNTNGLLKGNNIDIDGFMGPLKNIDLTGKKILLLGSGGGAAACAFGLIKAGGNLTILSRTGESAKNLAERAERHFKKPVFWDCLTVESLRREVSDTYLLVNATSVGYGDQAGASPVPAGLLRPDMIVYDIVSACETPLMSYAAAVGAESFSGTDMVAYTTRRFIEALTRREAPANIVKLAREAGTRALQYLENQCL